VVGIQTIDEMDEMVEIESYVDEDDENHDIDVVDDKLVEVDEMQSQTYTD
jgi:hypothetical protein